MNTAFLRHFAVYTVVFALVGVLVGCSPQYDWRMVSLGDGYVRAMLPAKPHISERELEFESHAITFVLASASVDGVLFTVGYAALPDELQNDVLARERLVHQTQMSLYRNLNIDPPVVMPAEGERFVITGSGHGKALQLEALVWSTRHALIEGIVITAEDALPQAQITEFLRELAPELRPDS